MIEQKAFQLTREKHMDHMVRVVPFIVMCYAVQCFVILRISPTDFSGITLSILGGFIALMVAGFITYDLKHQVIFHESMMSCHFFHAHHTIRYEDIYSVEVKEPSESFTTLTLQTTHGDFSFYFVDEAQKVKEYLESKKYSELKAA